MEKFVYLKGHLDGEAAKCWQGLLATNDNYEVAVSILKQRFGNTARRKASLMASLLNTPRFIDTEDLRTVRGFIDELTAKVRALEVLQVNKDEYGQLLLPVLKSRIPESWRLQWARYKESKAVSDSDLGVFLNFLDSEVSIRLESIQPSVGRSTVSTTPPTHKKNGTSVFNDGNLHQTKETGSARLVTTLNMVCSGANSTETCPWMIVGQS